MLPRHGTRAGARPERGSHSGRHVLAIPYLVAGLLLGLVLSKSFASQKCQHTAPGGRVLETENGSRLDRPAAVQKKRVLAVLGVQVRERGQAVHQRQEQRGGVGSRVCQRWRRRRRRQRRC